MNREKEVYQYWMACLKGISSSKKRRLKEVCGTEKGVFYIEETTLCTFPFLNKKEKEYLKTGRTESVLEKADGEWKQLQKKGVHITTWREKDYPERLEQIAVPPYALFGVGENCFEIPDVTAAIVGAREASPYGLRMAYEFGKVLASSGIYIISGMARGIDGEALRGAFHGAETAGAVLGCGVDICYPKENGSLYHMLQQKGRLFSEYVPGTPPLAGNFPPRNRIISALSDIILVMEAKERSGSLITADFALEQGKDVYALPGPVTSSLSKGCNRLILQGAGILLSPEELLENLPFDLQKKAMQNVKNSEECEIKLESPEKLLYSLLCLYPKSLTQLEEESGLSRGKLAELLLRMEMTGWVQEISKNYYIRLK